MVARILSLFACLLFLYGTVGLGMAQARHPGPPSMYPPIKVQMPGPPPPCGPGIPACPGQMCGPPSCPPPCPPPCMPSCMPPGCGQQNCGSSSWLNGFNPLCGLLSIVTAPFRLLANCVSLNGDCKPLPCCPSIACAPPCMPPCGPPPCPQRISKISKCKPMGMPPAEAYGYGYPPMGR